MAGAGAALVEIDAEYDILVRGDENEYCMCESDLQTRGRKDKMRMWKLQACGVERRSAMPLLRRAFCKGYCSSGRCGLFLGLVTGIKFIKRAAERITDRACG